MPRAIFVPLVPGGCRFSHHWQHSKFVSSDTTKGIGKAAANVSLDEFALDHRHSPVNEARRRTRHRTPLPRMYRSDTKGFLDA
jgi:hypothetical protein